jgi:chromosomal replication initiation ATPase DnaA|tara:strand:+ start:442 stop:783 length:342 start_codon:yes stop_codon:yes gene_type:complete
MLSFKHKVDTLKHIIHTQLDVDIESPRRHKDIVEARFIFFDILRSEKYGLAKIGASVGRDHASVLHGVKQTLYWSQTDKEFNEKYDLIKSLYNNAPSEVNFVVPKNEELVSLI